MPNVFENTDKDSAYGAINEQQLIYKYNEKLNFWQNEHD